MIAEKDTLFIAYNEDMSIIIQGLVHKGQTMDIGLQHKEYFYTVSVFLNRLTELEIENDVENLDTFQRDLTPPQLSGFGIIIPEKWEELFPDDKFIVGDFEISLFRVDGLLVTDAVYLDWQAFRAELLSPQHAALARQMGVVMRYLEEKANNEEFITIP